MKEIPPKINFELSASSPPWKGRTRLVFKDLARVTFNLCWSGQLSWLLFGFMLPWRFPFPRGNPNKSSMFSRDFPLQTIYFLGYPHDYGNLHFYTARHEPRCWWTFPSTGWWLMSWVCWWVLVKLSWFSNLDFSWVLSQGTDYRYTAWFVEWIGWTKYVNYITVKTLKTWLDTW